MLIEFDMNKFTGELRKLNNENGYPSVKDKEITELEIFKVNGWQDCMNAVIDTFKECIQKVFIERDYGEEDTN